MRARCADTGVTVLIVKPSPCSGVIDAIAKSQSVFRGGVGQGFDPLDSEVAGGAREMARAGVRV
jgi:hypothetical protein